MVAKFLLAAASVLGLASATGGMTTAGAPHCTVTGNGVVVTDPDRFHMVQVVFEKPVVTHMKPKILTRNEEGIVVTNPTIGEGSTFDFRTWSWNVSGLLEDHRYLVHYAVNQAHPCEPNWSDDINNRPTQGTCKVLIPHASSGVPGGNRQCGPEYTFTYASQAMVGVLTQSATGVGQNMVRFNIAWNRNVVPTERTVLNGYGINARNNAGLQRPIRDMTFGRRTWSFTVEGANADSITVSLNAGMVAEDAFGKGNAGTVVGEEKKVSISYRQDCVRVYSWGNLENFCTVNEGENCVGQEPGRIFFNGIVETATSQSFQAALLGGAACPAIDTQRFSPCTCRLNQNQCGDMTKPVSTGSSVLEGALCGGMGLDNACSCASDCLSNAAGCCADMVVACKLHLPSCASPDPFDFTYPVNSAQCQESARASDGKPLCYCDQWCGDEDNCCQNYDTNCFEGLCQKKAIGDFCNAEYIVGQYDGCQCDRDCIAIGDCCRDFTTFCGGEPLCATPGNCNKMMGSSTGVWCMCDHACNFQTPIDCCDDYNQRCEVQATCAFRIIEDGVERARTQPTRKQQFQDKFGTPINGEPAVANYPVDNANLTPNFETRRANSERVQKYLWTPRPEHLPAFGCGSVRFTNNNAWCSCDDECKFWDDCCPDMQSRCIDRRW